jgi:SAM-dependent methyltransferase
MRALPHPGGCFDLIGLYGNSFGFFDHAGNLEVLREMARCLRPAGLAVVTVPRFDYIAGFTAAAPLRWDERAETPRGTLHELGERYYDPRRGLSVGRCEQRNLTTGERAVRTGLTSLIYPMASANPAQPGLAAMAAESGFAAAALVPIPDARTANAKGLMSRMDCLVLTR